MLANAPSGAEGVAGKLSAVGQKVVSPGKIAGDAQRTHRRKDHIQLAANVINALAGDERKIQVTRIVKLSEMSWGRVENPKKVFKVGEKIKVLIKEITGTKIALSLKFEDANPWKNAAEKYAVGNVVTGTVARMTDFGAFIELEAGIDALLHVSQIAKDHVDKPSDVLKAGDEVTAKVVDFNEEDKKISLSVKAMFAPEPAEAKEESDEDVVSVDIDAVVAEEGTEE